MFRVSVISAAIAIGASVAAFAGAASPDNSFAVTNLVADTGPSAPITDPALVNGWGLSAGPTTPWWASDNGTNKSTLYSGTGAKQALTVTVAGGPTGTVFNGNASDFVVTQNGVSGAARFLFSTQAGTILGWSPTVNGTTAIPGVDRSSQKAVYRGLATLNGRLYATDFHNNRVDVFDASFKPVTLARGFRDAKLPKGYAPFGIQALGSRIFVTYAKQDAAKRVDVPGGGRGYVDEYTLTGSSLRGWPPAAARTHPRMLRGVWRSLRRASGRSPATCWSGTSGTAGSARTTTAATASGATPASSDAATARRSRSTVSGRSHSETGPQPDRRRRSTSSPGQPGDTRALRLHHCRLSTARPHSFASPSRPALPTGVRSAG